MGRGGGGRQQAGTGANGSLSVIGCESAMFAHFQDVTSKASMIGSHCVMRAKRTVEGTDKEHRSTVQLENQEVEHGKNKSHSQ